MAGYGRTNVGEFWGVGCGEGDHSEGRKGDLKPLWGAWQI